jgi:hypothetical protein
MTEEELASNNAKLGEALDQASEARDVAWERYQAHPDDALAEAFHRAGAESMRAFMAWAKAKRKL